MAKLKIYTQNQMFPVAEDFYGLFFEDINRAGDSGLYPEMLRNRAFEDSILPARCTPLEGTYGFVTPAGWRDQFNNGEGLKRWMENVPETEIPAWYTQNASMTLDLDDTLNEHRLASLKVSFADGGSVRNIGFQGLAVTENAQYHFYMFAKGRASLNIKLVSDDLKTVYASAPLAVDSDTYVKYDLTLTSAGNDIRANLMLEAPVKCEIALAFTSLMPVDTYKNHGMRKDLMALLERTHSRFLRFPGGCIVEGFTKETAMRFPNTVGPVWERPSQNLMWHYRTTNGLGFHEYLQICEDLNLEPMYVVNCGLTCQGRKPEYFEGEELDCILQEVFDAIEYATGSVDTKWGGLRAAMGHPEPFHIKYLEIGNENSNEVYFIRYKKFYNAIHEKYPELILISNTHTEKEGLPTQVVDEHLYSTSDIFTTAAKIYENYDRQGPDIFIGEYAVTSGLDVGNLKSALAETMYLIDAEKNQDIVKLTSYAPLFQNVDYTSWYPNLIAFNNHQSFGIPFYHALSMLAAYHGSHVLKSELEGNNGYPQLEGLSGIIAYQPGIKVKNVTVEGEPAAYSHGIIGKAVACADGSLELVSDYTNELEGYPNMGYIPPSTTFVTFGETEKTLYTYSLDVLINTPSDSIDITVWTHCYAMLFNRDETNPFHTSWNPVYTYPYVWSIKEGTGRFASTTRFNYSYFGESAKLPIKYGEYNNIRIVTRPDGFECYLNGELVQTAKLVSHPMVSELIAETEEFIYAKLVNYNSYPEPVEISLDCEIESDYEVECLTGDPKDKNTLEEPTYIAPVIHRFSNGCTEFNYVCPAYSFSILKLRKKVRQ